MISLFFDVDWLFVTPYFPAQEEQNFLEDKAYSDELIDFITVTICNSLTV